MFNSGKISLISLFLVLTYFSLCSSMIPMSTIPMAKKSPVLNHHSFRAPFTVPNWIFEGTAYFREHYIRLTPDRQSRAGGIWNAVPCHLEAWEAVVEFKIHGTSKTGADGLAMWYLKEKKLGSLFGVDPHFSGLGIVVDTYDNDGSGVHPRLMVLVSDGTQEFSHEHSHNGNDLDTMERGGCPFPARQTGTTSLFKVTYQDSKITVEVDHDNSGEWKACTTVENVQLPTGYFVGFTAATGQLADNHDLYSFYMKNLGDDHPEIYNAEQYTLQGFQYRIEKKLSELQNSVSTIISHSGSLPSPPSGQVPSLDTSQIDSQVNSLKSQIQNIQTDFRKELDSLKSKLEVISQSSLSLSSSLSSLPSIPSPSPSSAPPSSSSSSSSSSFVTYASIILLVVILLILVRFQIQTRKELKKKLF